MIVYNGYSAECTNLKELLRAVKRLPNTIKSLEVQSELVHFNPSIQKLNWSKDLYKQVKHIIEQAMDQEEYFGKVDKFYLLSYYGKGGENDPFYIKLSSEKSRGYAEMMSAGHYGKLD